jgi:hypothetical protein
MMNTSLSYELPRGDVGPQLPGAMPGIEPPQQNTNPITPRNPGVGINAGIESQAV